MANVNGINVNQILALVSTNMMMGHLCGKAVMENVFLVKIYVMEYVVVLTNVNAMENVCICGQQRETVFSTNVMENVLNRRINVMEVADGANVNQKMVHALKANSLENVMENVILKMSLAMGNACTIIIVCLRESVLIKRKNIARKVVGMSATNNSSVHVMVLYPLTLHAREK